MLTALQAADRPQVARLCTISVTAGVIFVIKTNFGGGDIDAMGVEPLNSPALGTPKMWTE